MSANPTLHAAVTHFLFHLQTKIFTTLPSSSVMDTHIHKIFLPSNLAPFSGTRNFIPHLKSEMENIVLEMQDIIMATTPTGRGEREARLSGDDGPAVSTRPTDGGDLEDRRSEPDPEGPRLQVEGFLGPVRYLWGLMETESLSPINGTSTTGRDGRWRVSQPMERDGGDRGSASGGSTIVR
jgi:hypothetical protein